MNIVDFSYSIDDLMFVSIKKMLQQRSEDIQYISSDKETSRYKINLKDRLSKSLDDLQETESIIHTGNVHIESTFGNIVSAANAEISAIEDPLRLTLKNNLLLIQKTTILDPESTEFEMMFFYLKNHVIELMRWLFADQFDLNKVIIEIRQEAQ